MSGAEGVKLAKLGTVLIGVTDLERSLAFYRDALGLTVQLAAGEFAFLDGGGVTLALRRVADLAGATEGRTELVFHVEDIDAACASLRSRGVTFRVEPRVVTGDQLAADFRDPDGHVLSIFGPRVAGGAKATGGR
jgi:catechol 2,3-dioxygenase-like lactoylglutathione lyase family enzyme